MESGTSETRLGSTPSHRVHSAGFHPGAIVAQRYRIVSFVGRGGMGEVYRADDLKLGQAVALKFLPHTLEHDAVARERLRSEVRNARTVSHPNVCRVYDIGEVDDRTYLTMEYIDGEDLASLLRRIGRVPANKALEIARQLCAGLAAAHDRGLLHRDLKPANVMIDGRGQARITDFGLAASTEAGPAGTGSADAEAELSGTPAYLAPERFDGKAASVQSDLYALGLILFELYTGKTALNATTLDGWRRAHAASVPSHPSALVSEIEPAVERAILRCLEKDPAKRPASATRLAASLPGGDPLAAALAAGETPSPELVAASGGEGALPRAQAWLWLGVCLGALVLGVTLGSFGELARLVPVGNPAVLQARAREILASFGYVSEPGDRAWWFISDSSRLETLIRERSPRDWFSRASVDPESIRFCYRESRYPLFTHNANGSVRRRDPAPLASDDAYLELTGQGRLRFLLVGAQSITPEAPPAASATDWNRVLSSIGVDPSSFGPPDLVMSRRTVVAADERRAWQSSLRTGPARIEVSVYRSRPSQVVVLPGRPASSGAEWRTEVRSWLSYPMVAVFIGLIGFAPVSRRHIRAGRADTAGANRLAFAAFVMQASEVLLNRHWTSDPYQLLTIVFAGLGLPLFTGAMTWVLYLGLEPFLRRRWPHMLVAWTRLLDGRWRDPLVGRSLLLGIVWGLGAVAVVPGLLALATRAFDVPLAIPWFAASALDSGPAWFLGGGYASWIAALNALMSLGAFLAIRLAVRRDRPAIAAWFLFMVIVHTYQVLGRDWAAEALTATVLLALVIAGAGCVIMLKHGLLTATVYHMVVDAVWNTSLTYRLADWYFWRTGVLVVLILAAAVWGFRNVLGRQTAFAWSSTE
jgi:hypothetical protein